MRPQLGRLWSMAHTQVRGHQDHPPSLRTHTGAPPRAFHDSPSLPATRGNLTITVGIDKQKTIPYRRIVHILCPYEGVLLGNGLGHPASSEEKTKEEGGEPWHCASRGPSQSHLLILMHRHWSILQHGNYMAFNCHLQFLSSPVCWMGTGVGEEERVISHLICVTPMLLQYIHIQGSLPMGWL